MSTKILLMSSVILALLLVAPLSLVSQETATRNVVILSPDGADRRLAAAREAIAFWNEKLSELKLPARLVEARVMVASPITPAVEEYIRRLMKGDVPIVVPGSADEPRPPSEFTDLPGDIVIFLSNDEALISFAWPLALMRRVLIAIRSDHGLPLSLPNVSRNVIAHELGHALGLAHHSDPSALMCGRPASCRPARYQSEKPTFFPLRAEDREELRRLHGVR